MPRNFDVRALLKDRRMVVRSVLSALLLANLLAAAFAFHVLGGSPEDLAEQMRSKQRDLAWQMQQTARMRTLVAKVQQAKVEGDKFLDDCTMDRSTAYSTLIDDLNRMAAESGMQTKEFSYVLDPVEGSDRIEQLTISANFEGSYGNLTKLINMLDKSPRFLIIDSMQASPQSNGALNVNLRLDTFVRQNAGGKS
jgi:type IV pilus assembly protein PilO